MKEIRRRRGKNGFEKKRKEEEAQPLLYWTYFELSIIIDRSFVVMDERKLKI
jgi:hypothetical protein